MSDGELEALEQSFFLEKENLRLDSDDEEQVREPQQAQEPQEQQESKEPQSPGSSIMTTLAGEQVAGVTALNTSAVFEDIYLTQGGGTYNPAAKGERGFMKLSAAVSDDGTNSVAHHLNTPLEIETAVAAAP